MSRTPSSGRPGPSPYARREAQRRRRQRRAQIRRRRATVLGILCGIGIVVALALPSGAKRPITATKTIASTATVSGPSAVEAGELPWGLKIGLSRMAVAPGTSPDSLVIAGGLSASGSLSSSARLRILPGPPTSGQLTLGAPLKVATHDVAATVLGTRLMLFGGGTTGPSATVQSLPLGGGAASIVGTLPQARADASAVAIGGVAYVVGGYDGPSLDAEVLATRDGHAFAQVAKLPVPVRYPAVAALGRYIYVFGGSSLTGTPQTEIQRIDPRAHTATVVGRLPDALEGAVAVRIGNTVYLAGGVGASGLSGAIYTFETSGARLLRAGTLYRPVAYASAAVTGGRAWIIGGETARGTPLSIVQMFLPNRRFGVAGRPGAGSPYYGDKLLIADRGNDRLLLVSDTGAILWRYPGPGKPPPPGGFYFPDDAFFIHHGTAIISNQEENETLVEIAYPSGKILWQYGHPHVAGAAPGYLNNPDDAYLLRNGEVSVADPKNCRVLVIDPKTKTVLHQIGTSGVCAHNPPTELGSPNGDTPLPDGNLLVSEINGSWIDEYTLAGHLVWTVHLGIVNYPSDPQYLGGNRYLVADYSQPGAFVEFTRAGRILERYAPTSGAGELNQPSLVEQLPSGVWMANDDYNDRIVAIDPSTGAVVWQYGKTGVAGTAPGLLRTPDGFDILGPNGTTPTHPITG